MAIDALILALDGVIFDTEETQLRACNAAFAACEIDLCWTVQQFREAARIHGASNAVKAVFPLLTKPQAETLLKEAHRLLHEYLLAAPPARHPGCETLMRDAMARGCKLAVVTDMPAEAASDLLQQAFGESATNTFSVVVGGADFGTTADNGPHVLALRTMGVDADACAAIHVAAPGLHAAQNAGIWTMAATPYDQNLSTIAGADMWCPQLQELRELLGRREPRHENAARFVTFDKLHSLRRGQLNGSAVPRSRQEFRPAA